jgi:hypothetical protein
MLCGRTGWLVSECKRINGGGNSMDIDRARFSCVLEGQDNQSVCIEYRSSLAGGTSRDTVLLARTFSCFVSAANCLARSQHRRVGATLLLVSWRWLWLALCILNLQRRFCLAGTR